VHVCRRRHRRGEHPHRRGQAVETWQSRATAGNMSSIDFDEVLVHVGEKGRYQNLMYYLLCIPATLPAAFLAFSQVSITVAVDGRRFVGISLVIGSPLDLQRSLSRGRLVQQQAVG